MLPKFFLWKVAANSLPTGSNLQVRGLLANTSCRNCGEEESIDHILFRCGIVKEVWNLGLWSDTPDLEGRTFKDILQGSYRWRNFHPIGVTTNLLPWICWCLWTARNLLLFENRPQSPQEIANKAIRFSKEWKEAQPTGGAPSNQQIEQTLQTETPSSPIYCNTDAAWISESKISRLRMGLHGSQWSGTREMINR